MIYEITVNSEQKIDFYPASKAAEILQNIKAIINTPKFSVPLDRNLGINYSALDKPTAVAEAMLADEIITAIQKYEPRVSVESISFTADIDGQLIPKVQVKINDE